MGNKFNSAAICLLILATALGCSISDYLKTTPATNSNQAVLANKTLVDQAADTVFGTEKTGIPQCDEILAELEKPTEKTDESILDNAKRVALKQGIYSQVRSASANASAKEKAEIGRYCAQVAAQLKPTATPQNSPAKK
ncbi:MAG: hypothetical protein ABI954_06680 [Pyrinomonadaceae bacterium]